MTSGSDPDSYPRGGLSLRPFDVIEETPSHDGTRCFSVWEDHKAIDERYAKWASNGRPKSSIQFYNTTPNSRDPEYLKAVAESIHDGTKRHRHMGGNNEWEDRLDVRGMAMPAETPDKERIDWCIAHMKAKIVARNITGKSNFFIPGTLDDESYRRVLIIISGAMDKWERPEDPQAYMMDKDDDDDGDGPFWIVEWGLSEQGREACRFWGVENVDPQVYRIPPKRLADCLLQDVKTGARTFYKSFLHGVLLEKEIARYVKRRAEHERGEVDWDALPEDEGLLGIEYDSDRIGRAEAEAAREMDSEVEEMRKQMESSRIEPGQEAKAGAEAGGDGGALVEGGSAQQESDHGKA